MINEDEIFQDKYLPNPSDNADFVAYTLANGKILYTNYHDKYFILTFALEKKHFQATKETLILFQLRRNFQRLIAQILVIKQLE